MTPQGALEWLAGHYEYIAVFEAYFDESGDPADPAIKAFTLSWLVASEKDWKRFSISWGRILRRYKIDVMHMKEYEHRIGQFSGWDLAKKESFAAELAGVTKNAFKLGHCHTLSVETWKKSVEPEMGTNFRKKRGAYVFLLQSCLEDLVDYGETLKGEKIACIFDENKLMAGKKPDCLGAAVGHYSDLKNHRGWDKVLAGITFENKRDFVPLQAADMLAYEGYKDMLNIFNGSPRPRRKLLTNLMQSKRIRLAEVDVAAFWNEVKEGRAKSKS